MQARAARAAARASLEGWRPPVQAALQPVLLLDVDLVLMAASVSATRLLELPEPGRPLRDAGALSSLEGWDDLPCVAAVLTGLPQRGDVLLASTQERYDVVASPLFGVPGLIGATAFFTAR